jgi:hypothetical protein
MPKTKTDDFWSVIKEFNKIGVHLRSEPKLEYRKDKAVITWTEAKKRKDEISMSIYKGIIIN